jgi:hypothetical protein
MSNVRRWTAQAGEGVELSLGQLGFPFSPGTIAGVMRPQDLTVGTTLMSAGTSGAGRYLLYTNQGAADHRLQLVCDTGSSALSQTVAPATANNWYIVAVTLSASGSTPRFHLKNITTSSAWQHEDGDATVNATGTPVTRGRLGNDAANANPFYGDIHAVAVWHVALSDSQVEQLATGVVGLPRGVWQLDQASTGTAVTDLTGGGANQASLSGTSVVDSGQTLPNWATVQLPHLDVLVGQ